MGANGTPRHSGETMSIGILSTGVYLPEKRMTALEIAKASGLPVEVVLHKLGITQKPIPSQTDHTNAMGVAAAKIALSKAKLDPREIDLIICISEEHKEFPVWTAGIDLAKQIGATRAWAFDAAQKCGSFVLASKLAKAMMLEDKHLKTVLIAGGYRNSDFIDYADPNVRFMYNLGAGGGAAILQRGALHPILGSSFITDGEFSRDVIVPVGGTCTPLTPENLKQYRLQVPDPKGMKARLEQKSLNNFVQVIEEAAQRSDFKHIDYLGILHMKPSAHHIILERLGLQADQTIYLSDYGHIGQIDQLLSLELGLERGLVSAGSRIVLASAGIGYVWNAVGVRW
jgi:3-oxoacyl-[acyl-carrier-protein] synthase III